MTLISNTSPLYYLRLIECVEILPELFGQIYIPESVKDELSAEGASETVRYWIASPPAWLKIMPVVATPDASLAGLHRGEQDAIVLGKQLSADLVILDEKAARYAAVKQGLAVTGLIGILDRAATVKLIEIPQVVARLAQTNFRIAPRLLKLLLEKHRIW